MHQLTFTYPTNRFNTAPQTTVSVLRLVDYATVSLISLPPSEHKSDAAPTPARNDASETRFAFLSESRIVELGTPEMAYEQTAAVVDYYQELNLDKDDATPDIQVQLNKIRMQWRQRASLNGNRGEEARAKLKMIENASNVFSNEDSRDAYDRSLRALPEVAEQDIDWIGRAWTYYFADDPGAASVAARKARSEHGDDPNAHVISAWIELAEENWREAKGYADEAYVLDELGEDTVDVYRVRGVTFYFTKKYEKGIECFQRALTKAPREMVPDIAFRMAACYIMMEQYTRAIDICVEGLKADAEMGPDTCDAVTHYCCVALEEHCFDANELEKSKNWFRNMRDKFTGLNVPQHLTATIIKFIDLYIKRIELLQVPPADPNRVPDFPLKAVGIAILGIIAFISYPHIVTLLFFAAPTAWVVFFFVRHAEYKRMKDAYDRSVVEHQKVQAELRAILDILEKRS